MYMAKFLLSRTIIFARRKVSNTPQNNNSIQYFMFSQYNVKSRKMSRPAHKSMQ